MKPESAYKPPFRRSPMEVTGGRYFNMELIEEWEKNGKRKMKRNRLEIRGNSQKIQDLMVKS